MYKIKSFNNAKEFQEVFGKNQFGGRKNKILLSLLKSKGFWDYRLKNKEFFKNITSMRSQQLLFDEIFYWLFYESCGDYRLNLFDYIFRNNKYKTDLLLGLCADGDITKVRILLEKESENGSEFVVRKTSPGKVFRQIIMDSNLNWMPEQVTNFLCEKFTEFFIENAEEKSNRYTLHVDKDFKKIYKSSNLLGNFHSCMNDMIDVVDAFYSKAVNASAARLENKNGKIVARCVIWNDVHDVESGKVYRLAERQYSTETDYSLMRILISKLIRGNHIDGYKSIGSGCHSPNDFVLNDGKPLNVAMYIECNPSNYVPYMDSFKYWLPDLKIAYNKELCAYENKKTKYPYVLEQTNGLNPDISFQKAYRHGDLIDISEEELDDYVFVPRINRYVYHNDILYCRCYENIIVDCVDGFYYSPYFEDYFCCKDCLYDLIYDELESINEHFERCFRDIEIKSLQKRIRFKDGRIMKLPRSFIEYCSRKFMTDDTDKDLFIYEP